MTFARLRGSHDDFGELFSEAVNDDFREASTDACVGYRVGGYANARCAVACLRSAWNARTSSTGRLNEACEDAEAEPQP